MVATPASFRLPEHPVELGPLLEAGFTLWWHALGRSFVLALGPALAGAVPALLAPAHDNPVVAAGMFLAWIRAPSTWVLYLAVALFSVWWQAALIRRLGLIAHGEDMALPRALKAGLARTPGLFGTWLLYGLAVLLAMAPLIALAVYAHGTAPEVPPWVLPALALAIVPIIWASVAAGLSPLCSVLEREAPPRAVLRSFALIRGHFWRAFAVALVALTVYTLGLVAAALALALFGGIAVALVAGTDALAEPATLWLFQIAMTPAQAAMTPLIYATGIALLQDLRLRKSPPE